jgi:hypothetical protein
VFDMERQQWVSLEEDVMLILYGNLTGLLCTDIWSNIILNISRRLFLNESNI